MNSECGDAGSADYSSDSDEEDPMVLNVLINLKDMLLVETVKYSDYIFFSDF